MTSRPAKMPSRQVLRRLPGRVVAFLQAVGSWPALGARLAEVGFTQNDHAEGMRLLASACAYAAPTRGGLDDDEDASSAQREIETWVREHFVRYQLALRRLHAEDPSPFQGIEEPSDKA